MRRLDLWEDLCMKTAIKGENGSLKVGGGMKSNWTALFHERHDLGGVLLVIGNKEESDGSGGALHACGTMNENHMTLLVFSEDLIGDLARPEFHVADFLLLEIVVDRNPILVRNQWGEWTILCTIKDYCDMVRLDELGIHGGFGISEP
jgi:hypothetical protein